MNEIVETTFNQLELIKSKFPAFNVLHKYSMEVGRRLNLSLSPKGFKWNIESEISQDQRTLNWRVKYTATLVEIIGVCD